MIWRGEAPATVSALMASLRAGAQPLRKSKKVAALKRRCDELSKNQENQQELLQESCHERAELKRRVAEVERAQAERLRDEKRASALQAELAGNREFIQDTLSEKEQLEEACALACADAERSRKEADEWQLHAGELEAELELFQGHTRNLEAELTTTREHVEGLQGLAEDLKAELDCQRAEFEDRLSGEVDAHKASTERLQDAETKVAEASGRAEDAEVKCAEYVRRISQLEEQASAYTFELNQNECGEHPDDEQSRARVAELEREVELARSRAHEQEVHAASVQAEFQARLDESRSDADLLRKRAEAAEAEVSKSIASSDEQVQASATKEEELQASIASVNAELQACREELCSETELLRTRAEAAESEVARITSSSEEQSRASAAKEEELQATIASVQGDFQARLDESRSENELLRKRAETAEAAAEESTANIDELRAQMSKSKEEELQATISSLKAELQSCLDGSRAESELLRKRVVVAEAEVTRITANSEEASLASTTKELELKANISSLQAELQARLDESRTDNELLLKRAEAAEAEVARATASSEEQLRASTTKEAELQATISPLEADVSRLEALGTEKEERLQELVQANAAMGEEIAGLLSGNDTLSHELEELRPLRNQLAELQQSSANSTECQQMRGQIRELLATMQNFKSENDRLTAENASISESLAFFEEDLERVSDRNAKLIGHVNPKQKLRYTLKLKDEKNQLRAENEKLRGRIAQLESSGKNETIFNVLEDLGLEVDPLRKTLYNGGESATKVRSRTPCGSPEASVGSGSVSVGRREHGSPLAPSSARRHAKMIEASPPPSGRRTPKMSPSPNASRSGRDKENTKEWRI